VAGNATIRFSSIINGSGVYSPDPFIDIDNFNVTYITTTTTTSTVCSAWDKGYRFGFNSMEKDNEVSGDGNSYTTKFRQLDVRLGRWFSIDPEAKQLPNFSPYNSMNCNPLLYTDIDGDFVPLPIYLLFIAMTPDILNAPTGRPGEGKHVKELIEQRDNTMLSRLVPPLKVVQPRSPGNYNNSNTPPKNSNETPKPKAETPKPKVEPTKPIVETPKPEVKSQPNSPKAPSKPNTNPTGVGKYSSSPPGNLTKLKNGQGWQDKQGNIWKKDMKHKDHWDVTNPKTGKKVKEIDFNGNQIWPNGPKNKNKQ
ncbi:MAG: hypothetical protein Q8K70_00115, partial [Bacteroidota bacterium]|nr:hypothetical protein [Bacteroidota bacterium]